MLGILGKKGVGKDLISDYVVKNYGYTKTSFAYPLKEACKLLFGFTEDQVNGDLKEVIDPAWGLTPRTVLQYVGTEMFRKNIQNLLPNIEDNFWVNSLINRVLKMENKNIVISDVRFQNEAEIIQKNNGLVIKLVRPGIFNKDEHASEKAQESIENYDYLLVNDGTIKELYDKVDTIMDYWLRTRNNAGDE